ncbi:hypothetical protein [Paenibacillus sp. MMS18-CY102]|uniref:hypothetical protein n=1 Tax=Paenibacillus sp. MMS18-CY102 TaxID=2682849 RepID=UPI0013660036|nr:hypothetical protein [Paenibacillus sp. MMS18-CY102]MWC27060.1 hypothetical protein [Paenibacillus sp. MMS18-CY102]
MSIFRSFRLTDVDQLVFYSDSPVQQKFDNVVVFLRGQHNEEGIFEDIIQEAVSTLYNGLKKCLSNELALTSELEVGKLGEAWNVWTNNLSDEVEDGEEDVFHQYWIWSTRNFQTWIYQKNGESFIEIGPSYKWHYVEPNLDETIISFNDFISGYRSYVFEVSPEEIINIIESLEDIKKELDIS